MRGKGELKGAPEQFYLSDVRFWAPERKLFWGVVVTPFGELGLKVDFNKCIFQQQQQQQQQNKQKQNKTKQKTLRFLTYGISLNLLSLGCAFFTTEAKTVWGLL